jgi:hypothetical protein
MDVIHVFACQNDRLESGGGIEPAVTVAEAEHFLHAVAVMHFKEERADDIVKAGTKAAAGDDAGAGPGRIEKDSFARAGQFEEQFRFRRRAGRPHDTGGNPRLFIHGTLNRRRKPRLAQNGDLHFSGRLAGRKRRGKMQMGRDHG